MRHHLAALLLVGCGGPLFAPVSIALNDDAGFAFTVSVKLERKLNPSCVGNCELGSTRPDGGVLYSFDNEQRDAGVRQWAPVDVMVGTTVLYKVVGLELEPIDPSCVISREVQSDGLNITAITTEGPACTFDVRPAQLSD